MNLSGLYQKNILYAASCLAILLLASSCHSFRLFQTEPDPSQEESLISQMRMRHISQKQTFICLYAVAGEPYLTEDANGVPQGIEPELLRRTAEAAGLRIQWVRTESAKLAPLLRSGHGDIAAGALRTPQIRSRCMVPVGAYGVASDFEGKEAGYAFMIREHDPKWQKILENAFAKIDKTQIVSREATVLSNVKVQLGDHENNAGQIPAVRLAVEQPDAGTQK